jgi:RNA polymerase sigma factor (sigma-70 family)
MLPDANSGRKLKVFCHLFGFSGDVLSNMMTYETMTTTECSDAELVSSTLAGDRDAFNRIVSRYQNLICSLAYSRIGNLGMSEDVAQETFITAWKHLRLLREPEKLRGWLCGIVRNRIHKSLEREGRQPVHDAEPLEAVEESPAREALPSEQAIGREEEAILWRSLVKIPEIYREPLILYYREHQSIEHVAVELELSEDAVKQRLSRGRKLLQEEVQTFVESALRRTAPGEAFSGAVLAALPLAAGPAVVAGTGAGVKGTAAAKSGFLAAALVPFIGILAGFAAQWMMVRGDTASERRTNKIGLIFTWIWVLGFAIGGEEVVRFLGHHFEWSDRVYFVAVAGFWWFFTMVMAAWIIGLFRRGDMQRQTDQRGGDVLQEGAATMQPGRRLAAVAGTHLMMFWAIITLAWRANDFMAAATIVGLMVALGAWNYFSLPGQFGLKLWRGYIGQLGLCAAVILAVLNLRFDVWVAAAYGISVADVSRLFPAWIVPVLTLVLVAWSVALLAVTKPKRIF